MWMLTEEQQMLVDSADRLVQNSYEFQSRRERLVGGQSYSEELWRSFAELGWLGICLDESDGGVGGGPAEMALLCRAFGKGLVTEPFLSTVVLGGTLVQKGGNESLRMELPRMVAGELQLAVGFAEPGSRYRLNVVGTTARSEGKGFLLNGAKSVVLNAASADYIIVSARTTGELEDEHGISLFAIPRGTPGMRIASYRLNDDHGAGDITLDNVKLGPTQMLGEPELGFELLESAIDQATVAVCAEAVGAMEAIMKMTLEYLNTREQFGRALGRNQALQFRMVELHYALEESRSMVAGAVDALASDPTTRKTLVSAAKVRVGDAARFIGQQGIQMHGAIGMTEDFPVGHYYKRLETLRMMFGDPDHHLARFGRHSGLRNQAGI